MHPISEETGAEAGQGVEPGPGPGNCRLPPSYLPHIWNSSEIPNSWTDTLELSRCMNYLEVTPMHNEFRNTSGVLSLPLELHVLERWICKIHKVKLRKNMCVRAGEILVGVAQPGFPRAFTPVCWCIFLSPRGITDGFCG